MIRFEIKTNYGQANSQVLKMAKDIEAIDASEGVIFDFNPYGENNPFSNLFLINILRKFRKEHRDVSVRAQPKQTSEYLSHIGFYKSMGIDIGKEPGEATGSSTYTPITRIQFDNGYDTIDDQAKRLCRVLDFDRPLQRLLRYIFQETIRNVYEHTETDAVLIAAQKWPQLNLLEIAIADSGCGVERSLGRLYHNRNEVELIKLACKPGVTAQSNYSITDRQDPLRNSGYGLYVLRSLALAYDGSFIICSGKHAIGSWCDDWGTEHEKVYDTSYPGTILQIRIRTDQGDIYDRVLNEIITRGERESKEMFGTIRRASKSSGGGW